ncbi:uncharacterized protein BJ171DRAFT_558971 [Polychytrium aggregatum]|uniref:uncharacterized protein n=1 Tax=Polychytrium aggregatum TaxID=110093 RepID=UPI0022FF1F87|nr:uncharacterized protein BJ171DRAFT_558971 [Polychytrium aggregatum]KAI9203186.1 hypothetical protein BJ171DRAFT_558971 [Polychytrium aggregatum]
MPPGTPAQHVASPTGPSLGSSLVGADPAGPKTFGDRFGLLGLLEVIRMQDPDTNTLALGSDLTGLGLNLNATENLYSTFMSPFAENPSLGAEPQFQTPPCYTLPQPPPAALSKLSSFSDETLFYIFYSMPRETIQEAAAQELFGRNWRFHKELKFWLTKDPGSEALMKGAGFERGVFIFFDPVSWSRVKKEWILYYDQLEERGPSMPTPTGILGRCGSTGYQGALTDDSTTREPVPA